MSAPKDTSMASPFASNLGTNYCPLDDEVLQIRALLKAPLSRLKQLDDQIAELQKAIDELAEERERVGSFVDRHKDLISPFRRLPLDVIQEIFVACLPTHRNCVMTAVEAPVLLGRICSAWRSISLNTPRLWARLHIVEPSRSGPGPWTPRAAWEEKLAQQLETTKTWLGRSGQCALSISFQGTHDSDFPPPPDGADPPANPCLFMDVILSVAPRWKDISLWASTPALEMLSGITEHDVPLLQKFEMSQNGGSSNGARPTLTLLGSPHLKHLSLFGSATQNIGGLPVRWENLTYLSAMGFNNMSLSYSSVLELLASPSLVTLFRGLPQTTTSLRIADRPQMWNPDDVFCVLDDAAIAVLIPTPENSGGCPALQELSITNSTAPSDAVLLQFLKARMAVPASTLKKVKIKFSRERQFDIMPDIQPFLDDGRVEVSLVYHSHSTTGAFSPWQGLPDAPGNTWTQDEFR
ncbi:hypothetical protein C8R46DRAFT_1348114 [Mycena filopes]|nr:hypothetical protein C8R46DRAFT_1348114 [Mycena filopes]